MKNKIFEYFFIFLGLVLYILEMYLVILVSWNRIVFTNIDEDIEVLYKSDYKSQDVEVKLCKFYICTDITDKLRIDSNVDTNIVGDYKDKYIVRYNGLYKDMVVNVRVREKDKPNISLVGDNEALVCPNKQYVEDGYYAIDAYDGDISGKVKVENNDDEVIYSIEDSSGNTDTKSRKLTYKDVEAPVLTLEGNEKYTIYLGDTYEEKGYKAIDNCNDDISDRVIVSGNVDTSTIGDYTLTYEVEDDAGNKSSATRIVSVKEYKTLFDSKNIEDYQKDLETYIEKNHYQISVGYYNIETGYTYTYKGTKQYFACSQVKAVDALYAYENMELDDDLTNMVKILIEKSDNYRHLLLINRIGLNNLKNYARNTIGMKLYLTGNADDYYGLTNVEDQLILWKYLANYVNNQSDTTFRDYFTGKSYNYLLFDGAPLTMHKPGYCADYWNESGLVFADSQYIAVILSYNIGNLGNTLPYISSKLYEMNDMVSEQ